MALYHPPRWPDATQAELTDLIISEQRKRWAEHDAAIEAHRAAGTLRPAPFSTGSLGDLTYNRKAMRR